MNACALVQGRFISWAPEWRPGSRGFPPGQWRFDNAPTGLPGYPDMLQWEVRQRLRTCSPHCRKLALTGWLPSRALGPQCIRR